MLRNSFPLIFIAALVLAATGVRAAPAHKCLVNGTVTYQQGACASDQVRKPPTLQELNAAEKRRRAAAAARAPEKVAPERTAPERAAPEKVAPVLHNVQSGFSCDRRAYCSQMKSCAEAKYFLANCPGVKMDGNRDGTPCQKQWCGR